MKKIIMFEGDIETQGYFSRQMKAALEQLGHAVYLYDLRKPWQSSTEMIRFIEKGNTVVLSFNFHGICQEPQFMDENGMYIWEGLSIPVCNILADHPYYYYNLLAQRPPLYYQCSIDGAHQRFMERFFPEVARGPFLPLAGTKLSRAKRAGEEERCQEVVIGGEKGRKIPFEAIVKQNKPIWERPIDVLFTGNYASPERFEPYITRLGEEYTLFYYEIINDLLANPMQNVEDVVERYMRREIPEVTEEELKQTMQNITFIDLYIRYKVRGQVVQTLVDSGIKVHVFGDKWDELPVLHPENLVDGDSLYSEECLAYTCESKICINVLPWFKEGGHDRIYNTMLNGAVLLTDSNPWLSDYLREDENCKIFDLTKLEELPQMVRALLEQPEQMQQIAQKGLQDAKDHTWHKRMEVFHTWVEQL